MTLASEGSKIQLRPITTQWGIKESTSMQKGQLETLLAEMWGRVRRAGPVCISYTRQVLLWSLLSRLTPPSAQGTLAFYATELTNMHHCHGPSGYKSPASGSPCSRAAAVHLQDKDRDCTPPKLHVSWAPDLHSRP